MKFQPVDRFQHLPSRFTRELDRFPKPERADRPQSIWISVIHCDFEVPTFKVPNKGKCAVKCP
jgi:hypothetical protein